MKHVQCTFTNYTRRNLFASTRDMFVSCIRCCVIGMFFAHLECSFWMLNFENRGAKQIISKMIINFRFPAKSISNWTSTKPICDSPLSIQSVNLVLYFQPLTTVSIDSNSIFISFSNFYHCLYIWCLIKIMRHFHKNPFYFENLNHLDCRFVCVGVCAFLRYFGVSYDKLISLLSL